MTLKDMPLKKVSQRSTLRSLLLLPSARDSHTHALVPVGDLSAGFSSVGTERGLACCPAPSRRNHAENQTEARAQLRPLRFPGSNRRRANLRLRGIPARRPSAILRDNIKAVYLVHNARAIGFGIGAGAGAVIGAAATHGPLVNHELFAVLDAGILRWSGLFLWHGIRSVLPW